VIRDRISRFSFIAENAELKIAESRKFQILNPQNPKSLIYPYPSVPVPTLRYLSLPFGIRKFVRFVFRKVSYSFTTFLLTTPFSVSTSTKYTPSFHELTSITFSLFAIRSSTNSPSTLYICIELILNCEFSIVN